MKQTVIAKAQQNRKVPKSQPSRLWFMSKGYDLIDPTLVFGRIFYIRVKGQEVSILDANGRKGCIYVVYRSKKSREKHGKGIPYQFLKFCANGHTRYVSVALLVMATFNHKVPDRSIGEVIDHIDGNTLNNNPNNLRIVTRAINDRDAGFMRKLRNNGYNVAMFPGIILAGYKRMAQWKAEHTQSQYKQLRGKELLRVFVGPQFTICDIDPMDLDFKFHREY